MSLFESGRNDEALKCLEEYIRIKPNSKEAWCYKGIILKKLKRYEEAMECQNRALKVDPFYESAKEEKGIIEGILKQQTKANAYTNFNTNSLPQNNAINASI